jgi:hypothetical protein
MGSRASIRIRFAPGASALLALVACAANPAGPSVVSGQEFQLRPGMSVTVEGTDLGLRFDVVASDSRCPADAVCVALGDAEAVFTISEAGRPATSVTLHTRPGEGQQATVGGFSFVLTRLDPYPSVGSRIPPDDYRASLRVEAAAGR